MQVAAVFPTASAKAGMYESFYLRAVAPREPVGVWIRCTVHKRPAASPRGSVWCTVFDAARGAPFMHKLTTDRLSVPAGGWIEVDQSRLGPGHAEGRCGPASWSLRFENAAPPLRHLPHELLYRAPLPRTKSTSPAPAARFEGTLRLADRTLDLDGWHGMVGHNWGSEHAERWIWLHGIDFDGAPGAWLDLVLGRVAVGGRISPWLASGAVSVGGRCSRLGGLLVSGMRVAERPLRCSLQVPGRRGLSLEAHVQAPEGTAAGWRYADPHGGQHDVINCSIASLQLVLRRPGAPARTLHSAHGGAYELGVREHDHGVPVAPFIDG